MYTASGIGVHSIWVNIMVGVMGVDT